MNVLAKKDYSRLLSFMLSVGVSESDCYKLVYRSVHKLDPDHTLNKKDKEKVIPNFKCQNGLISHSCCFHTHDDNCEAFQFHKLEIQANGTRGNNYQLLEIELIQDYPVV